MRARRTMSLIASAAVVAALVPAAAGASAPHVAKATLRYFLKVTGQSLTTPSGAPVSSSQPPAAGDILFITANWYVGTKAHHASTWTATAFSYCTVTNVVNPNSNVQATCDAVIAIGGSMLTSISTQNLASSSRISVYPIVAGTGKYLHAQGDGRDDAAAPHRPARAGQAAPTSIDSFRAATAGPQVPRDLQPVSGRATCPRPNRLLSRRRRRTGPCPTDPSSFSSASG